jgi:4'-phosphopantetheinyl transferase EntD
VRFAVRRPGAVAATALREEEAAAVARAVDKRKLEMAAGRDAARAALASLGVAPMAIPRGERGAPVWPDGVVGSITHTDDWCLAAVAREADLAGLGIDAEPRGPIEADLWPAITTGGELDDLRSRPAGEAAERARLLFCAKEAAYKCQFPLTRTLLEFGDLAIRLAEPSSSKGPMGVRFAAEFRRDVTPFASGDSIEGRLAGDGELVLAVASIDSSHDGMR